MLNKTNMDTINYYWILVAVMIVCNVTGELQFLTKFYQQSDLKQIKSGTSVENETAQVN